MEYRPFGLLDIAPGFPAGGVSGRTPTGADDLGRLLYSMTGAGGAQDAAGLLGGPSVRENLKAGNNFDAGLQMLAALPVVGMLGTAGKAAKGAAKVAEEAAPAAEKYITAYHGSPHSFDRFDMSKIGTGEGAQAYGHGLYFAGNENVARQYRDQLSDGTYRVGDDVFNPQTELKHMNVRSVAVRKGLEDGIARAQQTIADETLPEATRSLARMDLERLQAIATTGAKPNPGSMYQVRINADPDSFLDWDRPLSEQSPVVRDAVNRAGRSPDVFGLDSVADDMRPVEMKRLLNSPEGTSALAKLGVPGIKYLDGGSRMAGDGSRNYVVFDDSMIEILKKYGLLGAIGLPAAMGAAGANQGASPEPLL